MTEHIGGLTFPNDLLMQSKRSTVSATHIEADKECGLSLNDKSLLLEVTSQLTFLTLMLVITQATSSQVAVLSSKACLL